MKFVVIGEVEDLKMIKDFLGQRIGRRHRHTHGVFNPLDVYMVAKNGFTVSEGASGTALRPFKYISDAVDAVMAAEPADGVDSDTSSPTRRAIINIAPGDYPERVVLRLKSDAVLRLSLIGAGNQAVTRIRSVCIDASGLSEPVSSAQINIGSMTIGGFFSSETAFEIIGSHHLGKLFMTTSLFQCRANYGLSTCAMKVHGEHPGNFDLRNDGHCIYYVTNPQSGQNVIEMDWGMFSMNSGSLYKGNSTGHYLRLVDSDFTAVVLSDCSLNGSYQTQDCIRIDRGGGTGGAMVSLKSMSVKGGSANIIGAEAHALGKAMLMDVAVYSDPGAGGVNFPAGLCAYRTIVNVNTMQPVPISAGVAVPLL